ncbi:MAG TPA: PRC-barrel domain-containing protein [Parvibaculum sp.]
MKRLLTGTALLTLLLPVAAMGAEQGTAPMTPPAASRVQVSPDATTAQPLIHETDGAAVLSDQALSARYLRGISIVDTKGDKLGSLNDIVFDDKGHAELAIISAGGVAGLGGRDVGVNFGDLMINVQTPKSPTAQLNSSLDTLKAQAEFDRSKLPAGQVLASDVLGAAAKTSDGADAKLTDIIMDKQGAGRYAAIEYGGIAGVGGKRVAVDYAKISRLAKGATIPLDVKMADLQAAPPFIYEPDDTTASIPSAIKAVTGSTSGSPPSSSGGNSGSSY